MSNQESSDGVGCARGIILGLAMWATGICLWLGVANIIRGMQ